MKALTKLQVKVEGDQVTITGTLSDFEPHPIQSQRVTQVHHVSTNPRRPRHIQQGTEGLMVKRRGAAGFCFPRDEMVWLALQIDKGLTDAPALDKPAGADLSPPTFRTELPATLQWHESADQGGTWAPVDKPSGAPGTWAKAVATNAAGSSESNVVKAPSRTAGGAAK